MQDEVHFVVATFTSVVRNETRSLQGIVTTNHNDQKVKRRAIDRWKNVRMYPKWRFHSLSSFGLSQIENWSISCRRKQKSRQRKQIIELNAHLYGSCNDVDDESGQVRTSESKQIEPAHQTSKWKEFFSIESVYEHRIAERRKANNPAFCNQSKEEMMCWGDTRRLCCLQWRVNKWSPEIRSGRVIWWLMCSFAMNRTQPDDVESAKKVEKRSERRMGRKFEPQTCDWKTNKEQIEFANKSERPQTHESNQGAIERARFEADARKDKRSNPTEN